MAKRLWEKGEGVDSEIHHFTVGNDPVTDLLLVRWDALASIAHGKMLAEIGILDAEEEKALFLELSRVLVAADRDEFSIPVELEDCHTAIENALVEKLGEVGKKIHTGRSRNDQVLVAMRLWLRNAILDTSRKLLELAQLSSKRGDELRDVFLPGYTHMQPAMPASFQMWLHAIRETALSHLQDGLRVYQSINTNPLGVASGFGVPLALNRDTTTELLAFDETQRNPIAVQNSRGKEELKALRWCVDIASLIEKFSSDMLLYSMSEFDFIKLPVAFTTGSSIMPQKRNPDVLELLRARTSRVRACEVELSGVISKLPSNYHRDFQYTKEPVIHGFSEVNAMLAVFTKVVSEFEVNREKLESLATVDLYATYDVYRRVREGKSFRDAYVESANAIKNNAIDVEELKKDFALIQDMLDSDARGFNEAVANAEVELKARLEALSAMESKLKVKTG